MFVGCNICISKPHLPRALVNVILIVHTHTILTVIFLSAVAIIIVTVVVCIFGDIIMKAPGC